MYDTFIQFNQQIETFQQFLTVIATVLEAYLGLIALSWFIASLCADVAVDTQLQTETAPNANRPEIEFVHESPVVLKVPAIETSPAQQFELGNCSVSELRQIARDVGLYGYSRLSKGKLLAQLQELSLPGMVPA